MGALFGGLHALLLLHWLPGAARPLLGPMMGWAAALAVWALNAAAVAVIAAAVHRLRSAGQLGRMAVPPLPVPVTLAAGWVVLGWLPSSLPGVGFPWLGPEAALVGTPVLAASAPWLGGAGVAGLLTFTGAAVGQVLAVGRFAASGPARSGPPGSRRPWRVPWRWLVVAALPWVWLSWIPGSGRWVEADGGGTDVVTGEVVRVAALSVEADPLLLTDGGRRTEVLMERIEALMGRVEPGTVDFILWPESPTGTSEPPVELEVARRWSRALATPVLFGVLEGAERRNRLLQATPDSRVQRLREKRRLVPMVEARTSRGGQEFSSTFPLPVGARSGDEVTAGALICFEALFGGEGRALRRAGARVLLLPSNEGWLVGSGAGWNDAARSQHRAAAALRAAELAVPVVRSAVGGPAGAWDGAGRAVPGDLRTVPGVGAVYLAQIRPAGYRVPAGSAGAAAGAALVALLVLLSGVAPRIHPVEAG